MEKKAAFYTLGCKVNQYETQMMTEKFREAGFAIVGEEEAADVYVVNTCTVTRLADRKSRQYIRRMKKKNPDCVTVVVGCYSQVSPEEVEALEEVDLFWGTGEKGRVVERVLSFLEDRQKKSYRVERGALTEYDEYGAITSMESRTRAIIKIQEGCDRFCTYCMIPFARGRVRSRSPRAIREEAELLLKKGFRELVLTGINTALYGTEPGFAEKYPIGKEEDPEAEFGIERILGMLDRLPGDFRIRLGSLEPTVVNAACVKRLFRYEKLCHHLHLSLQSGSDAVLKRMNRRYDRAEYLEIADTAFREDPGFGFSTDIIVGFPGESERDFEDSVDMTRRIPYCKVHVFPYSRRPGTRAAEMEDQISAEAKKRRGAALSEAGEASVGAFFKRNEDTVRRVLFEEYDPDAELYYGYTDNYIRVYTASPQELRNTFAPVRLLEAFRDGMRGRIEE